MAGLFSGKQIAANEARTVLRVHRGTPYRMRAACKMVCEVQLDLQLQSKYGPAMQYNVVLVESEEGFTVSCPALPGCHSQGTTHDEALANIREAIRLWLEVAEEDAGRDAAAEGGRFTR